MSPWQYSHFQNILIKIFDLKQVAPGNTLDFRYFSFYPIDQLIIFGGDQ
jgi:hypothetical protein